MSARLALAHAIEDAGIPREKAENVASVIACFLEGSAATKRDVERAEAALKANVERAEASLRAGLREIDTSLRSEVARLDAKVEQIGSRTFSRLGALVVVVAGLLFAALHAWPPHP
jgi:hypothetical protein